VAVQLTDEVLWLNECYEHGDRRDDGRGNRHENDEHGNRHENDEHGNRHEHVSVYLVDDGERRIVVDTGSFYHREAIAGELEAAIGESGVDAIVLSHSDYPHSGNVRPIRERWDDVTVYASSGAPESQGLPPTAVKCEIGRSMDVAGRRFSFVDPPLADRSHTTWIYDHGSEVLFTADGFGSYHDAGDCDLASDDMPDGVPYEAVYGYHDDALVWLRYVDPAKLRSALEAILSEYDPAYVAPVHGHPVARADVDEYLDRLIRAAARISDEHPIGR
jgi:flavorubredoxin